MRWEIRWRSSSAAAPHQSKRDKIYYRREGGCSVSAPHFYIELLRQRLTSPKLEAEDITLAVYNAYETAEDGALLVILNLTFRIRNVGRVVAVHWALNVRHIAWPDEVDFGSRAENDIFFFNFPDAKTPNKVKNSGIRVDSRAIPPDCAYSEKRKVALRLRPDERSVDAVAKDLEFMISNMTIRYQLATESSPGESADLMLGPKCKRASLLASIQTEAPEYFQ